MKSNNKKLEWNEEWAIEFKLNGKHFSTPKGRGFFIDFEAKDEAKRLQKKGATEIKIYKRTWN